MSSGRKRVSSTEATLLELRRTVAAKDRERFDWLVKYARARCEGKYVRSTLKLLHMINACEWGDFSWYSSRLREMPMRRAETHMEITVFGFEECGFDDAGHVYKDACRCAIAEYLGASSEDTYPIWLLTIALGVFYNSAVADDFDSWKHYL